jgi:hypothetical protein
MTTKLAPRRFLPSVPLALFLLASLSSPAIGQEEPRNDGLLLYGAVGNIYAGGGLYRQWSRTWPSWYGEFNLLCVGVGHHWNGNGWMLSTCALAEAPSGQAGDWMFTMGMLPVLFHAYCGAESHLFSGRPALQAYAGICPLAMTPYVEAGAEAKWRLGVVSPSVRATWRGTQYSQVISLGVVLDCPRYCGHGVRRVTA